MMQNNEKAYDFYDIQDAVAFNNDITHKVNKINDLEAFKKKTIYDFSKSGKAICNGVNNDDKWFKETLFYINSYNRLSIQIPNGEFKQLVEPKQINQFWEWLFENQDRVGDVKDYYSIPDISLRFTIESVTAVKGGVCVNLKDKKGAVIEVMNKKRSKVLDVGDCKRWFESQQKYK